MSKLNIKFTLDTTTSQDKVTLGKEDKKKRVKVDLAGGGAIDPKNADNTGIDKTKADAFKKKRIKTTGNSRGSDDAGFTENLQPSSITAFSVLDENEENYVASKIRRAIYLKRTIRDKDANGKDPGENEFGKMGKKKADGTDIGVTAGGNTKGINAPRGEWTFVLKSIENSQELHGDVDTLRLVMEEDLKLDKIDDLANIIDLNDYTITSYQNNNDEPQVMWDFSKSLNALIELEKLLEESYQKFGRRQIRYSTKGTHGKKDFLWYSSKSPDFDPDGIIEHAKKLEEYQNYEDNTHTLYFTGNTPDADGFLKGTGGKKAAGEDDTKIKSELYRLDDGQAASAGKLYKNKIDFWLDYFEKSYRWAAKAGLTNNHELLLVHRLGFQDVDASKFTKDKKFKGFPILTGTDGNPLEIEKAAPGDTTSSDAGEEGFKIKGSADCNTEKYTNTNVNYVKGGEIDIAAWKKPENYIRAFRGLEVRVGGTTTGAEVDPFWDNVSGTKTSIFNDIKRSSRQDLFGFQPQDLSLTFTADLDDTTAKAIKKEFGTAHDLSNGVNWKWDKDDTKYKSEHTHLSTRVKFLLRDAKNMYEAVEIAFAGKLEAGTEVFHNLDPEIPAGTDANFNQAHTNKQAVLKDYYDFIKRCSMNWTDAKEKYIPKGETLDGVKGDDDTQTSVNILDKCYKEAEIWAEIWDTPYSSVNDKKKCEDGKAAVEKILAENTKPTTGEAEPKIRFWMQNNPVWKKALEGKKTEITNRINKGFTPPTVPGSFKDLLANTNTGPVAKLIYEKAKAAGSENDKPSTQLTTLAGLIDKVKAGTADASDLTKLEKYSGATAGTEEKKAWDLANEVKDSGIINNSTKGAGADALQKLKNDKELKDARDAAKGVLGNAYDAIGIGSKTSVSEINDIKDLFAKLKQAWGLENKTDTNYQTLSQDLDSAKNNAAWKAIDNYKKNNKEEDCTEGYATGALNKLKGFKEQGDKGIDKMKKATTPKEVRDTWMGLDKTEKDNIPEETTKRLQVHLVLKDGDEEEKKLDQALWGNKNDATNFADNDEDLKAINEAIEILKKYKDVEAKADGDEKQKILAKLKAIDSEFGDPKDLIKTWLTSLENRKQHLEAEKQKRDKTNPQTEPGFDWFGGPMIALYCVVGAAIVGGIAWLVLKGGSEGEEEGGE